MLRMIPIGKVAGLVLEVRDDGEVDVALDEAGVRAGVIRAQAGQLRSERGEFRGELLLQFVGHPVVPGEKHHVPDHQTPSLGFKGRESVSHPPLWSWLTPLRCYELRPG